MQKGPRKKIALLTNKKIRLLFAIFLPMMICTFFITVLTGCDSQRSNSSDGTSCSEQCDDIEALRTKLHEYEANGYHHVRSYGDLLDNSILKANLAILACYDKPDKVQYLGILKNCWKRDLEFARSMEKYPDQETSSTSSGKLSKDSQKQKDQDYTFDDYQMDLNYRKNGLVPPTRNRK